MPATIECKPRPSCCRTIDRTAHRYRTRPSLLLPLLRSAGLAAGVLAALAPAPARDAVFGALQEAVIEVCNDGLRALREAQLVEQVRALHPVAPYYVVVAVAVLAEH
jgi:demethoxyubiquinone hydroxylase (CLK1/Coq7/Cat5 family)